MSQNKHVENDVAICDFCNRNVGIVQDIASNLSIIICKECEKRMKKEADFYKVECNICGDECTRCSY